MLRYLTLISLITLASCTQKQSPREVAESYLSAVQSADLNKAGELYCLPGETNSTPLGSLSRYEIVSEEETSYEGVPYTKITARVDSAGSGGGTSKNWDLWVMTSDDAYAQVEETNKQLAAMGGSPVALDRSEWSDKDLCILIPH